MTANDPTAVEAMGAAGDAFPAEPYKGLAYYDAVDRRLFSGRDGDVDVCVQRLTASETRILLVHGHTGCGKSSFLRAGLIPELESLGLGYLFLRDAAGVPLFIRSGPDPLLRLAEHIFEFAQAPLTVQSSQGPVEIDLSAARLGMSDLQAFVRECRVHSGLRRSLQAIAEKLPYTLVIIVDQMEEVITLYENGKPFRRQFFQFIKSFSTVNFAVKFVFALRKDYSGQFIELAQPHGSIDLRSREEAAAEAEPELAPHGIIRSDVKLYLLPELDREKVRQAIELPTSEEATAGGKSPFEVYRFRYGPKVVDRMLDDLFERSGTAVLPAMQIVCRKLYEDARPGPDGVAKEVTLDQYVVGGDIRGPIDWHITKSLREAICSEQRTQADIASEERKWRKVLFGFVRVESDGTAHTRELDLDAVARLAKEAGARCDARGVVDHLTRPDVLLLRSVHAGLVPQGVPRLSLGHDFIAMVLSGREAERWANEKVRRVRRKAYSIGGIVVALASFIAIWTVFSRRVGQANERYQVLTSTAESTWRQQPMSALMAAAVAMRVADSATLFAARDQKADRMVADLLWSLPESEPEAQGAHARAANASAAAPARVDDNFPLARSQGFLAVDDDRAILRVKGQVRTFDFPPLAGGKGGYDQMNVSASELDSGDILLLRARIAQRAAPTLLGYQIHVLHQDGTASGPYSDADFAERSTKDVEASAQTVRQVTVTGPFVVFSAAITSESDNDAVTDTLHAYEYDAAGSQPFKRTATLDDTAMAIMPSSQPPFLFSDGRLLLQSGFQDATELTVREMDLKGEPKALTLLGKDVTPACPGGCSWKWLPFVYPGQAMVVYGAPDLAHAPSAADQWSAGAAADLSNYAAFMLLDVAANQRFVVTSADIGAARSTCSPFRDERGTRPTTLAGVSAFVTRATAASSKTSAPPLPVLGIVSGSAIDLLQIVGNEAKATVVCKRALIAQDSFSRWTLSADGARLLGAGATSQASWILDRPGGSAQRRLETPDNLRRDACARGVRQVIQASEASGWRAWQDLTHLTTSPRKLCSDVGKAPGPAVPSAASPG